MRDIGELLRTAREKAGLSQAELAERIHGSRQMQSAISDLERGVKVPTVETLQRIADALDCELVVRFEPRDDVDSTSEKPKRKLRSPQEVLKKRED